MSGGKTITPVLERYVPRDAEYAFVPSCHVADIMERHWPLDDPEFPIYRHLGDFGISDTQIWHIRRGDQKYQKLWWVDYVCMLAGTHMAFELETLPVVADRPSGARRMAMDAISGRGSEDTLFAELLLQDRAAELRAKGASPVRARRDAAAWLEGFAATHDVVSVDAVDAEADSIWERSQAVMDAHEAMRAARRAAWDAGSKSRQV